MSNKVTSFSKQLYRVYSGPLDKNAYFDNIEDFEDYLAGITAESGNIYSGQVVSVRDPSSEIPLVFVIANVEVESEGENNHPSVEREFKAYRLLREIDFDDKALGLSAIISKDASKIKGLQDRVDQIETSRNEDNTKIAKLKTTVDHVSTENEKLKSKIQELENEIEAIKILCRNYTKS